MAAAVSSEMGNERPTSSSIKRGAYNEAGSWLCAREHRREAERTDW
jgi:hypothetical protein